MVLSVTTSFLMEVNTAFFSPDGNQVLSAAADKTAKIWCSHTGRCLQTLSGHGAYVRYAVFGKRGILTASADWTARLWTMEGSCLQTCLALPSKSSVRLDARYEGHSQWVNMANFAADEERVVTCSRDSRTPFHGGATSLRDTGQKPL